MANPDKYLHNFERLTEIAEYCVIGSAIVFFAR